MSEQKTNKKIAIIRLRGHIKVAPTPKYTMDLLNLKKVNTCVVVDVTPSVLGMIKKIKDYVTYGEANEETLKLLEPRKKETKKPNGKVKIIYTLHPPRKGFERKGIKKSFNVGGALGDRKDKINDLIKKMI